MIKNNNRINQTVQKVLLKYALYKIKKNPIENKFIHNSRNGL